MKKFVATFLSVLMSFSAVSALPETNASSAQNVSYKIVNGKDAVLTELKFSEQKKLKGPIEGRYNIIEIADNASKVKVVPEYYGRADVVSFWLLAAGLMCSPFFMFAGFLFDNPDNVPKMGKIKGNKYVYSAITSVDLPYCKKVGKNAFLNCKSLRTVNLPKCTALAKESLACCHNVTKLDIPECLVLDNPFGINTSDHIRYEAYEKLKELNAPKCTRVESRCFGGFVNLEKANLQGATSIGCEGFALCKSLKTISLNSCTEIQESAFKKCRSLRNIDLPNCKKIGRGAFEGCAKVKKLNAPKVTEIGAEAFGGFKCQEGEKVWFFPSDLEEVYVPNCNYIGENAFDGCKKLKKITVSHDKKKKKNALPDERVQNNKLEIVRV